jgi:hypothetical protein
MIALGASRRCSKSSFSRSHLLALAEAALRLLITLSKHLLE